MIELYKAECRRFGRWALGLGVLHAAVLFFLDRTFPGMRDDDEIAVLAGFAYGAAGAIFGFYQCASYARMNHWIALLHRPLAPWRIMASVTGAAATLLFVAVLLPLVVFTAALTLQVGRVVDARHWPMALAGALIALLGFGIGSYVALAPRRYGWTALVAAGVFTIGSMGTGTGALLLPLLVIAVLTLLVVSAFKPDRSLPPVQPALLGLTAAVAALSLYFLLLTGGGLAYQLSLAAIGRNPLVNTAPPGGLVEASRAESDDLLAAALATNTNPETAAVRASLRGVEAMRLPIAFDEVPTRGGLTNVRPITFTGPRRSVDWTYSHDSNSFLGLRLKDRRPIGELRPAGGFEAPPILLGDGSMIAGGSLYRLDSHSGALVRRLHLPGELILAKPVPIGSVAAVLSDRALHFVHRGMLDASAASGKAIAVPLPGLIGDLRRIDLARLPDRTVISFLFGRDSIEGPSSAWQRVVSVAPHGEVRTLAQRRFGPELSEALRFRSYWLSPALRVVAGAVERVGSGSAWSAPRARVNVPQGVWIAAGLLSLAAAAAATLLAQRRRLSVAETAAWALAALALSLPMFAAFSLIRTGPRLTA